MKTTLNIDDKCDGRPQARGRTSGPDDVRNGRDRMRLLLRSQPKRGKLPALPTSRGLVDVADRNPLYQEGR